MITILGTADGIGSIRANEPMVNPETRERIELVTYRDAIRRADWHAGAIVFTDLERLYISDMPDVTLLWQRFAQAGAPVRLMNHPTRTLRRFALLRRLRELGINDFDVWRADEMRADLRFPVFLHGERDHNGPIGGLLPDRAALDRALGELAEQGHALNQIIVTEFCETRSPDGLYRKMGTLRFGDRFVHRHLFHSIDWCVKARKNRIGPEHSPAAIVEEETRFVLDGEVAPAIPEIFGIAGIDYGRMDYAFKDGSIRVWEINTSPMLGTPSLNPPGSELYERFIGRTQGEIRKALLALDPDDSDAPFWIEPVRGRQPAAAARPLAAGRWRRLFGRRA
jgi:hypothetical protein